MVRYSLLAALVVFGAVTSASASTQDDLVRADQQCIGFSLLAAADKDKDLRDFGLMSSYFYLARLQTRAPEQPTAKALVDYFDTAAEEDFVAHGERCMSEISATTDVFGEMAKLQKVTPDK